MGDQNGFDDGAGDGSDLFRGDPRRQDVPDIAICITSGLDTRNSALRFICIHV